MVRGKTVSLLPSVLVVSCVIVKNYSSFLSCQKKIRKTKSKRLKTNEAKSSTPNSSVSERIAFAPDKKIEKTISRRCLFSSPTKPIRYSNASKNNSAVMICKPWCPKYSIAT